MTENEKIQKFLSKTDFSTAELAVKNSAINLDAKLREKRGVVTSLDDQLNALVEQRNAAQAELTMLTSQLQGALQIILNIVDAAESKEKEDSEES